MKNSKTKISEHINVSSTSKIIMIIAFFIALFSPFRVNAQQAYLEGRIKKLNGQGVPGITVLAVHVQSDFRKTTTTDAEGYYRFNGIPEGTYRIIIDQPGRKREIKTTTVRLTRIDRNPASTNDSGAIMATTTRTKTKSSEKPPTESPVAASNMPRTGNANRTATRQQIYVYIPERNVNFIITGRLTGIVTNTKNKALADVRIKITDKETNLSREILTDSKGQYEIEEMGGTYRIEIQTNGFKTKTRTVEIENGKSKMQNFRLKRR